jgi:hypothetical protein
MYMWKCTGGGDTWWISMYRWRCTGGGGYIIWDRLGWWISNTVQVDMYEVHAQ